MFSQSEDEPLHIITHVEVVETATPGRASYYTPFYTFACLLRVESYESFLERPFSEVELRNMIGQVAQVFFITPEIGIVVVVTT